MYSSTFNHVAQYFEWNKNFELNSYDMNMWARFVAESYTENLTQRNPIKSSRAE